MAVIKNHKKIFIVLLVVVIVAIIAIVLIKKSADKAVSESEDSGVTAVAIGPQDLSDTVNADGKVESRNIVAVTTELTTKCSQLNVALGDHVEAGDILCVFDTEEIDSQIATLEKSSSTAATLAKTQTDIAAREVQSAKDSQTTQLNEQLTKINALETTLAGIDKQLFGMTEEDENYEELKTQRETTATELTTARAEYDALVVSTNNAIQQAQDNYDTTSLNNNSDADVATQLTKLYKQRDAATIVAEQSGTITSLNISQGGIANGTLMVISDPTALQVSISVREKDILKMKEGMQARITSDAIDGGETALSGSVVRVINFTSGNSAQTDTTADSSGSSSSGYSADINVNEPGALLLGMSVKVEIVISDAQADMAVAYDSIITEDEKSYVLVAEADGDSYKLKKVAVTVGASNDYYTEVSSANLKEGDLVVSTPDGYSDGDVVKVVDVLEEIDESLEEEK